MANLLRFVWSEYLGQPADDYQGHEKMIKEVKNLFLSDEWFIPLDLLELVYNNADHLGFFRSGFEQHINGRLDATNAAYSFIEGRFIDRLSDAERSTVEQALHSPSDAIQNHLNEAFRLLADRHNAAYE